MARKASTVAPALDLRRQEGYTLVELLTVAAVMVMVITAVYGLYRIAAAEQDRVESNTSGLQSQRIGVEKMTRELRNAKTICSVHPTCSSSFSNSTSIDFETCAAVSSTGCSTVWVRYNCSGSPAQAVPPALTTRACLRSQSLSPASLGSSESVLIGNVATSPTGVFTFTAPDYVTVSVRVVTKGKANPISIKDGVRTRNTSGS